MSNHSVFQSSSPNLSRLNLFNSARLVWDLTRKDLLLFFLDPRAAFLCFAIPIILGLGFGKIFESTRDIAKTKLSMILVVEDDHPLTRQLVQAMRQSTRIDIREETRAEAQALLTARRGNVAVIIPSGMGASLSEKTQLVRSKLWQKETEPVTPAMRVIHSPEALLEASWAEGVMTEIVWKELAGKWLASLLPPGAAPSFERPFPLEQEAFPKSSASFNSYSHSFSGMSLQYLLFWGMDSGLLLLRERKRGVWRRLRCAPVPLSLLLLGRIVSTTLVAFAQVLLTMGFAWAFCGVTLQGSYLGFVIMALSASLMAATMGMLVAVMGQSEARARNLAIVAILGMSMIGGYWLPSFLLPEWVKLGSMAFPTTWALRGFEGVFWTGANLLETCRCALIVSAYSIAALVIAFWWLARQETHGILEKGQS